MLTGDRQDDQAVEDAWLDTDLPDPTGAPSWVPLAGLAIVAAGLAVSIYLTVAHYDSSSILACPGTHLIDCQRVTTSPESRILGIPVAILGLVFFAFMAAAMLPAAWRTGHLVVRYGRVLFALTGVGMVFYLVYTELLTLDALCLWCTAVHVLTVALFVVTLAGTVLTTPNNRP
ncbi:vitamin K epoxide reductase family protein [Frankia sp. AgB1.9]|uniref:vitamin K epoxide reductase family protein n=1 Tax=unclassified Frankia TaxID=2632575 RepID=UPI00193380E9|nr:MULTISPECIES: vitamin K epoxide reductase family protein [unclassified Frankia]MBL7487525.1 vitamin K epoxide reductase family protein [Frankia sp. AgW1.1]MBL7549496.1 vitamin K epoxide reductase family protein [Frankia sp. AgB1.9]MBL7620715.1 vitamin K epoxide reductase family protein [Frankia sp. AgB1.8]